MREDYPRTLSEFEARFSTEQACRAFLAQLRWPDGFVCPRCQAGPARASTRQRMICTACRYQASVTAGTIFQGSRQPLTLWFRAIWWVTAEEDFNLGRILNYGYLPSVIRSSRPKRLLSAYIGDYLQQEVAAEGLVRNLPAFAGFLDAAALSEGSAVNFSKIASECGVSHHTAKSYFGILEDTLLGRWLPAYRKRRKRRVSHSPKFYFCDTGIVNRLVRRGAVSPKTEGYGRAFENWVFHELSSYVGYREIDADLTHWRLPSGIEVDFVLGDMLLAIETKASERITNRHMKGLRILKQEHPHVERRIVVCLEPKSWRTDDGIEVVPAHYFAKWLWRGELA